ncbi:hypothetical protein NC656_18625 [Pseudomonas asiatica]|uniref:hypothetical protein n=1 Tax=Pseudomonas TaxID=286 RepID=UPI0010BFD780|nr:MULTISPECIES: hypothetical protein [Pseudomonas]MCO8263566.1 hypothetical protein [Pseudomonas asiatica]MDV5099371.1 hypothetical protein [Pseudomonas sp. LSJ-87]WJD71884.1 hypothetical protein QQ994_08475 [Pseudomonas asiatica]
MSYVLLYESPPGAVALSSAGFRVFECLSEVFPGEVLPANWAVGASHESVGYTALRYGADDGFIMHAFSSFAGYGANYCSGQVIRLISIH